MHTYLHFVGCPRNYHHMTYRWRVEGYRGRVFIGDGFGKIRRSITKWTIMSGGAWCPTSAPLRATSREDALWGTCMRVGRSGVRRLGTAGVPEVWQIIPAIQRTNRCSGAHRGFLVGRSSIALPSAGPMSSALEDFTAEKKYSQPQKYVYVD